MITLHNNDDMSPRRKYGGNIKLKPLSQYGARQGHKEDRVDTTFDSRPKRKRTRNDIDRAWRQEYDM